MNANKRIFSARAFVKEKASAAFSLVLSYINGQDDVYVDGLGNVYVTGTSAGIGQLLKLEARKVNFTLRGWNNG